MPDGAILGRLLPALREAGVLELDEPAVVHPSPGPRPDPPAGGAAVLVTTPEPSAADPGDTSARGASDVHVHIGRVEVVRAAAHPAAGPPAAPVRPTHPPAVAPPARAAPGVDHADYLVRRQERR
ncbi:hypothetical protein [Actinomycetospora sp. NBRC 106375]|uniref:hypothetical protein n=1 Tax=Actinomycetospora sp. NBRC 106375 TaxID=3032207 RepID=UPI0025526305|nr:hypothetical protein [Actinomycetospora sp. NBRC 106375]